MRIVFWGTPEFAVPALRALGDEGHDVVAVVTQPDRPAGRGRELHRSPVKVQALDEMIPVLQPEKARGDEFIAQLRAYEPDLSVVVAYGQILKPEVLAVPRLGSVNIHASLLPGLRGAAPIQWAIIRGVETTGVTIMKMDAGLDSGPMLLRVEEPIEPDETGCELGDRLSEIGAEALVEALALLLRAQARPRDRAHRLVARRRRERALDPRARRRARRVEPARRARPGEALPPARRVRLRRAGDGAGGGCGGRADRVR